MPVTLQQVDLAAWEADAQVRLDLARIYADAPAERLPLPVDNFIRDHLKNGHLFSCARFNDRLLGAVAVIPDQHAWWLSNLCVRKTARRRGVGSRLLMLVSEAAHVQGRRLYADSSDLPVADQMLLSRLGYRLTKDGDYFELDLSPKGGQQ
ncbi:acetyl-CoA sensor PanZ family protein [Halomonas daqiaonensis]|uniref:Acetyltransferase (GNAT) domain-containing protein n=1 Tax=Halomonas daqiaonensis TaxID=650850 RepID=A0A1H7R7Y6_9GAMM|nr:acetyl-CoA sensor PanZ family protein [Halomonas daqiaonensis]SEL56396.1 Acetyltransferase (GNAT) domain-containing protein [Halomonas daqiaonensis]